MRIRSGTHKWMRIKKWQEVGVLEVISFYFHIVFSLEILYVMSDAFLLYFLLVKDFGDSPDYVIFTI